MNIVIADMSLSIEIESYTIMSACQSNAVHYLTHPISRGVSGILEIIVSIIKIADMNFTS
jgi:hypothetical protein